MKKRIKVPIWYAILGMILISWGVLCSSRGLAAELPRSLVIGDQNGVTVSSDGIYFIDIPNALPGESYEKVITIRSTDEKEPFELGLRVRPKESTGGIDWNEHVIMTLKLDGKEIYKGKMLGDSTRDWTKESLSLGTFQFGSDKVLTATFKIDQNLTNDDYKEKNTFLFEWEFIATRNGTATSTSDSEIIKKPFGKLPQTGEEWREAIYKTLAGLLLILVVLLLWKRKKQEKTDEQKAKEQGKGEE